MESLSPDERWPRVEALFLEAADLPPDLREEFLNGSCGDDTQLREEVLSLLRYDTGEEAPFLDAFSAAKILADEPAGCGGQSDEGGERAART